MASDQTRMAWIWGDGKTRDGRRLMAIFMSDEELRKLAEEAADAGVAIATGFNGFHALEGDNWSPTNTETMRRAYWVGARCCFDALHRLGLMDRGMTYRELERFDKIKRELGNDPFCAPPLPRPHSGWSPAEAEAMRRLAVAIFSELGLRHDNPPAQPMEFDQ